MVKITEQVRIKKDYFMEGYYSVHLCRYRDGKPTSERLIDYAKKKKDAQKIKRLYLEGKIGFYGNKK